MRIAALVLIAVALRSPVAAQAPDPPAIVVDGIPHPLTAAALETLRRDSAVMAFHEQPPVTYSGVALTDLLRAAGVRADSLRGPALAMRVVLEASDGYRIVVALAELDPTLGGRRMILADRMNGRPLPADEAPWRLVIPGDQRPSRSARSVVTIRVLSEPR